MTLLQAILVFVGGWIFLIGGFCLSVVFDNKFLKGICYAVLAIGILGIIVGGYRIEHTIFID